MLVQPAIPIKVIFSLDQKASTIKIGSNEMMDIVGKFEDTSTLLLLILLTFYFSFFFFKEGKEGEGLVEEEGV